jgi:hypothetical protein
LTTSALYVLVSFVNTAPHPQHFVSSNHPIPRNLSERLALIVLLMGNAIAAGAPRTPVTIPIINLVRSYLNRLVRRVAALARRVEAGTAAIRPRPPARPDAAPRDRPAADPRRPAMPRGVGWLYRLVPFVAANRSQLRFFLAGEEVAALLAAAPQAARLLRPLCRMLAIARAPDLPAALFPERAKRPARPRAPQAAKVRAPKVRAPRVRPSPTPLQLYPTKTWQEREALDHELAAWHAARPEREKARASPPRPPPRWGNNGTSR